MDLSLEVFRLLSFEVLNVSGGLQQVAKTNHNLRSKGLRSELLTERSILISYQMLFHFSETSLLLFSVMWPRAESGWKPNLSLEECDVQRFDKLIKISFLTDLCTRFHPLFAEMVGRNSLIGGSQTIHHWSWMMTSNHPGNNGFGVFRCFRRNFVVLLIKMLLNMEDVFTAISCMSL